VAVSVAVTVATALAVVAVAVVVVVVVFAVAVVAVIVAAVVVCRGGGSGSGSSSGSRKSRWSIRRGRAGKTAVALQGARTVKGNTGSDVLPFRLLGDAPEQGGDKASKKQPIAEAELRQGIP